MRFTCLVKNVLIGFNDQSGFEKTSNDHEFPDMQHVSPIELFGHGKEAVKSYPRFLEPCWFERTECL